MARFKDLCLDANDHRALADWWCRVLGYIPRPQPAPRPPEWPIPIVDPGGQGPLIWIVPVPERKTLKNRMHLDVFGDTSEILGFGATLLRARGGDIEWDVLADPEGNEFCVFAESSRARTLAEEFTRANNTLIELLERASPEQWRTRTADEGELRSVGVIAYHVAQAHGRIAQRVAAFARGEAVPPRRPELFDERNAREASDNPEPDQQATIVRLRDTGARVARLISGLTDQELERSASEDPGAPALTTAQVIELRQIAHVRGHLTSIATVLGTASES